MAHRFPSGCRPAFLGTALVLLFSLPAAGESVVTHPYQGVTRIVRTEIVPRAVTMHISLIDLRTPGISFAATPHSGTRETTRQTTADFVRQQQAQVGINVAFFDPDTVPASANPEVFLAGLHVSQGQIVSGFDPQPRAGFRPNQSYAIVPYAPALNLDASNHVMIVHRDPSAASNYQAREPLTLWNTISGSAQIIADGHITIPEYQDAAHPNGQLSPGGSANYSNANSWYAILNARTAIGITRAAETLVLFTVDRGNNSGMTVAEVAQVLLEDYHCYNALNLDGGGSTSMAPRDPDTGEVRAVNKSSDANYAEGRPAGANLAVFAHRWPHPLWAVSIAAGSAFLMALCVGAASRKE